MNGGRLKVLCVRTGDKYSPDYVLKLRNAVRRNLTYDHDFVCLTDRPPIEGVQMGAAEFEGWWGKLSLFNESERPCLYFDLDTVIVGSVDPLARAVVESDHERLLMLRRFNPKKVGWMSGVMAWVGDWSFIRREFSPRWHVAKFPGGDQDYITMALRNKDDRSEVLAVQSVLPGVCSYKMDVRRTGRLPDGARVVCFHGRPKITQARGVWITNHWR